MLGIALNMIFRYIIAQILGSYLTCLIVYVQWKDLLVVCTFVLSFFFFFFDSYVADRRRRVKGKGTL